MGENEQCQLLSNMMLNKLPDEDKIFNQVSTSCVDFTQILHIQYIDHRYSIVNLAMNSVNRLNTYLHKEIWSEALFQQLSTSIRHNI